jgi:hypothetical protein
VDLVFVKREDERFFKLLLADKQNGKIVSMSTSGAK